VKEIKKKGKSKIDLTINPLKLKFKEPYFYSYLPAYMLKDEKFERILREDHVSD
jgi:hypothetical protein